MGDDEVPSKKKTPSEIEEEEKIKRRKKVTPGSLMKAVIRSGGGTESPKDGDLVVYHCSTRTVDGVIVHSTRLQLGGKGYPTRYVLGKSKMILGLCEGIPTMLKGEVAMFKMKPELHYAEEDCPVSSPEGFPKEDELHFEVELLDFGKAKVVTDDLGIVKKVLSEGQGWESPREPYEVTARITAKSLDGNATLLHTSEPFCFTFGKYEVPKGLEMGIGTMTRGEKAAIYVNKMYLTSSPLVSFADDLEEVLFEVNLLHFIQVRDMLGDGRLIKRRIVDGRGEFPMDCPLHDSLLRVHYKGMILNDEKAIFYDTRIDNYGEPLEFHSGEGRVPEGFEMAVRLMLPGEISLVTCPPDYAYDKFTRPAGVPDGAYVQWEIELLSFETPKDWTGLNFQRIMEEADIIKNTGNRLFKEGKYDLAKAKYEKVLREYNHVNPQDDEEGKIFLNSRNALHLNVAACHQKMGEYRKSIEICYKVLETNPVHVKALYRRGMGYMLVGDHEEARKDFNMMITIDKSSEPDATAALSKIRQKEQEIEKAARKQFKGLFDKKPGEISEATGNSEVHPEENHEADSKNEKNSSETIEGDDTVHAAPKAEGIGLVERLWLSGRRFLTGVGLNRCSIL